MLASGANVATALVVSSTRSRVNWLLTDVY
jgi:hypothetical protein